MRVTRFLVSPLWWSPSGSADPTLRRQQGNKETLTIGLWTFSDLLSLLGVLTSRVAKSAHLGCVAGLDFLGYMSGWQNKVKAKTKMFLYSPELKMPLLQYRLEAMMVFKAPYPLSMLGSLLLQHPWRGGAHAPQIKLFSRFIQPCWVELDLFCGLEDFNLRKVGCIVPKGPIQWPHWKDIFLW